MGPKPKHLVAGPNQSRLDGFFTKFPRRSESSSTPRDSESLTPREESTEHGPETREISSAWTSKPTMSLASAKRLLDVDSDIDDTIVVGGPPKKSPRTSPEAESVRHSIANISATSFSSELSALRSPTPPSPKNNLSSRFQLGTTTGASVLFQPQRGVYPSTTVRPPTAGSGKPSVMTSFGSSRASMGLSSQRTIKNGEEIVRNSDSEGSDGSFEDLDDILGISKPTVDASSPLTDLSRTPTPPRGSAGGKFRRPHRVTKPAQSQNLASSLRGKVGSKFDLNALLGIKKEYLRSQANCQETKNEIASEQKRSRASRVEGAKSEQIKSIVATAGEDTDASRVLEAISRTEALAQDKSWSFFDYKAFQQPSRQRPEFDLGDHPTANFLKSEEEFKNALVCGYMDRFAQTTPFSIEMRQWLFHHSLHDPRSDVRKACTSVLTGSLDVAAVGELSSWIETALRDLGRRDERPGSPAKLQAEMADSQRAVIADWSALQQILWIWALSAPKIARNRAAKIVYSLARMAVDSRITRDGRNFELLCNAFNNCIARILNFPNHDVCADMMKSLFNLTDDDELRLRVLDAFPQADIITGLARRQLALAWLYNDVKMLELKRDRPSQQFDCLKRPANCPSRLLAYVKSKPIIFGIRRDTNYGQLKAKLELIAVGIGGGDPPWIPSPVQQRSLSADAMAELKHNTKTYNAYVDDLARHFGSMHAETVDKGTSHITRTEVKDLLERLKSKLLRTVRTKPPVKRDLWGDVVPEVDDVRGGSGMMNSFARMPQATSAPQPDADRPTDDVAGPTDGTGTEKLLEKTSTSVSTALSSPTEYHDAVETILE